MGRARWRRKVRAARLTVAALLLLPAILAGSAVSFADERPWADPSKSPDERAALLRAAMTLDEEIALLHGSGMLGTGAVPPQPYMGYIPPNERLGIPALKLHDGPGGVGEGMTAVTQFPAPVAGAATWDSALMERFGKALGTEEWGKGANVALAPTINIVRIPQWGRSFESFGEDPYLASRIGVAVIKGIQAAGPIATVKHFAVYNQEINRGYDDEIVSEQAIQEIYLPAFEAAVKEAGVGAVMSSYNKLNGPWTSEDPFLLTNTLRGRWGFDGFTMSDWGGTHSTVAAANAGLDMEMPGTVYFGDVLKQAVLDGSVSQDLVDDKVFRILRAMFRAGLFDRPQEGHPWSPVLTPEHAMLAREIAEQGSVLLKNDGTLPIAPKAGDRIAVIGAAGGTRPKTGALCGSAEVVPPYMVSPLAGIAARVARSGAGVLYDEGADSRLAAAVAAAADVAIVFWDSGTDIPLAGSHQECEGLDRRSLALPNGGDAVIEAVAQAQPNTVVVIHSGAPVLMPWAENVPAIIEAWFPGQEDGNAMAALLFGDVNPSGKLPITFPVSESQIPTSTREQFPGKDGVVHYSEGVFVGYRWYDAQGIQPLFPFGHGLSYTTFGYGDLAIAPTSEDSVSVTLEVTNTGTRAGAEVVQLYVGTEELGLPEPPKQLRAFRKVFLEPGESATVSFDLGLRAFAYWDTSLHDWRVEPGCYQILVGNSSRDIRVDGSVGLGVPCA